MTAVLGSHVLRRSPGYSVTSEAIKGGKLRALAVAADRPDDSPSGGADICGKRISDGPTGQLVWRDHTGKDPADTTNQLIGWLKKPSVLRGEAEAGSPGPLSN